nr:MAG TPA: Toxin SymE, type I toxin-antitoxin system [Caudoviricetes sp.]
MAKLAKMKYKTMGGDVKINTYNATISKKIVAESGLDPDKEITVRAETGKIIIEQKR